MRAVSAGRPIMASPIQSTSPLLVIPVTMACQRADLDGGHSLEGVPPGLKRELLLLEQDLSLPCSFPPLHLVGLHHLQATVVRSNLQASELRVERVRFRDRASHCELDSMASDQGKGTMHAACVQGMCGWGQMAACTKRMQAASARQAGDPAW